MKQYSEIVHTHIVTDLKKDVSNLWCCYAA
jgi:hypothetical protein